MIIHIIPLMGECQEAGTISSGQLFCLSVRFIVDRESEREYIVGRVSN
jgi:hypothetical protein